MTLGPIELVVIGFPGSRFNGQIRPQILDLVDREIVNVIDALLIVKDETGEVMFLEVDASSDEDDVRILSEAISNSIEMLSDEDVDDIAAQLEPGSSALALVFEHRWMRAVRDAIHDSGGVLVADIHVPAAVVDEVLAAAQAS